MKKFFLITTATVLASAAINSAQAQTDLTYVAVSPCRVADTRGSAEGVINANTFRNFRVSGSSGQLAVQGGQVDCLDPKSSSGVRPTAVAAYILAIPNASSTGRGVLSAYPSNQSPPPVGSGSTVNFGEDQAIGNTSIVSICSSGTCPNGGELAVLARNSNQDVVIDVQGYFYPVQRPTIVMASVQEAVTLSGSASEGLDVDCPTGSQLIGGGGFATGDAVMTDSYPVKAVSASQETWSSRFVSRTGDNVNGTISAIAICVSGFNPTVVRPPSN